MGTAGAGSESCDAESDAAQHGMIELLAADREHQPDGGTDQQQPRSWSQQMEDPVGGERTDAATEIHGRFIVDRDGM